MTKTLLGIKAKFDEKYYQRFPQPYLEEMSNLGYKLAQNTKPLYLSLIRELFPHKEKDLSILDIGCSYGINTLLLKYGLELETINQFFLKDLNNLDYETLVEKFRKFLNKRSRDDKIKFFLLDISQPAIDFNLDSGLCEEGFAENLEEEDPSNQLAKIFNKVDLFISTGCIGYIGIHTFKRIFQSLQPNTSTQPLFAFSCLRMFCLKEVKELFKNNGYEIYKIRSKPIIQRRFKDIKEQNMVLKKLEEKNLETIYEKDGHYYADFFVAGPIHKKEKILNWLVNLEEKSS